jgi:hypothetical protein
VGAIFCGLVEKIPLFHALPALRPSKKYFAALRSGPASLYSYLP